MTSIYKLPTANGWDRSEVANKRFTLALVLERKLEHPILRIQGCCRCGSGIDDPNNLPKGEGTKATPSGLDINTSDTLQRMKRVNLPLVQTQKQGNGTGNSVIV